MTRRAVLLAHAAVALAARSDAAVDVRVEGAEDTSPQKSRQVLRAEARAAGAYVIDVDPFPEDRAPRFDLRSSRTHPTSPKRSRSR